MKETEDSLKIASLKDPVRVHEKSHDYAVWTSGAAEIAEAIVPDVLRARVVCSDAHELLRVVDELIDGLSLPASDGVATSAAEMKAVRFKNK